MVKIKLTNLYQAELISGILLMLSFVLALVVANTQALQNLYKDFVFYSVTLGSGSFFYKGPLIQIVNDGLMTLFFLLLGLELKFHLVKGEFQSKNSLRLPGIAAIGGILVPLLIYVGFNINSPQTLKGWAIPIATDTAFMLGILSFFGKFISTRLRAFIIGFSLIDDAVALLLLAIFYTQSTTILPIILTLVLTSLLFLLNRLKVTSSFYYLFIGIFLWASMVEAGIHGTLCGVVIALLIPVEKKGHMNPSFHGLENVLRPMVYFLILPLFAFINSGVAFNVISWEMLNTPLALGIVIGLFAGKQLGIFTFSYIAVKLKYCVLPAHVKWSKFYAISVLSGIGFTLSLFIGDLTFESSDVNYVMRLSVIIGSVLSAVLGVSILIRLKFKSA